MARELKMIKTKRIELRACPCCGAPPVIHRRVPDDGSATIRCAKLGCVMVMGQGIEDAAETWNQGRFTDTRSASGSANNRFLQ